jgi:hypothetical protein
VDVIKLQELVTAEGKSKGKAIPAHAWGDFKFS